MKSNEIGYCKVYLSQTLLSVTSAGNFQSLTFHKVRYSSMLDAWRDF